MVNKKTKPALNGAIVGGGGVGEGEIDNILIIPKMNVLQTDRGHKGKAHTAMGAYVV